MVPHIDSLHIILSRFRTNNQSRKDINYLIEKSYIISLSFLKVNFKSKLQFLKSDTQSIEDIAMDAIVPLFVKSKFDLLGIQSLLYLLTYNIIYFTYNIIT